MLSQRSVCYASRAAPAVNTFAFVSRDFYSGHIYKTLPWIFKHRHQC